MKPEKQEGSQFKTFIDADEARKIAGLVYHSPRNRKIEDCARLFVEAERVNRNHTIDSLMGGSMAMYEVQRAAFESIVVQVLIEAAYAVEEADIREKKAKESEAAANKRIDNELERNALRKLVKGTKLDVDTALAKYGKRIPKELKSFLEKVSKHCELPND